jgi:hypothetical protein
VRPVDLDGDFPQWQQQLNSSTKKEIDRANPKISAVHGQFIDQLIGCIFGQCPEAIILLIRCAIFMTKSPLGARLLDRKLRCVHMRAPRTANTSPLTYLSSKEPTVANAFLQSPVVPISTDVGKREAPYHLGGLLQVMWT